MDLHIHAINLHPSRMERVQQDFKPKQKIRFTGLSINNPTKNLRLNGEEAMEIFQRGRQDHLFLMSAQSPLHSGQQKSPILRRTSLSPIKRILQPDLFTSSQSPRPHSLRLRGAESQEIWKRSCGTCISLRDPPPKAMDTIYPPTAKLQTQCWNEEFLQNLSNDRFSRQNFLEEHPGSSDVKFGNSRPRLTKVAEKIAMRDHGRITDSISSILNQGWSETAGIRRIQTAADGRRSKSLTPYSGIDNVADIWNSQVQSMERKTSVMEPSKDLRHSHGVAAALCSNQNASVNIYQAHPRVKFEGIEIARKSKGSSLFSDSTGSVNHLVMQKNMDYNKDDSVKHLIAHSMGMEALPPPPRQRLSSCGSRIARRSRGGGAKACINPSHAKPTSLRAFRK